MAWNGKVKEAPEQIPEGTYKASLTSITETDGQYGKMVQVGFTLVTEDEFNGEQVNGVCSTVINEKSKLGRWINAIIGRSPQVGEEITEEDLLRKDCQVEVEHTRKNQGTVFANVTEVLPTERKSSSEEDDRPF